MPRANFLPLLALLFVVACTAAPLPVVPSATPVAAAPARPELVAIDLFGTTQIRLEELLAVHGAELRRSAEASINDEAYDDAALWSAIAGMGDFAYLEPSLVGYYEPEGMKYYLTIDVVDRADAVRRLAFAPEPTGSVADPDGLLADWLVYETKVFALLKAKKLAPGRVACAALHCFGDHRHPELQPLAERFAAKAPRHLEALGGVLARDADPSRRASAAFLIAYAGDGPRAVEVLLAAFRDPSALVRNNAMRVIHEVTAHHPELAVPLAPVLAALEYPATTDRNKAAAILAALLDRPGAETQHCTIVRQAGATLLAMLRLEQPNNHDFAYEVLRKLSGTAFGERDHAAWEAWLSAQLACTDSAVGTGATLR